VILITKILIQWFINIYLEVSRAPYVSFLIHYEQTEIIYKWYGIVKSYVTGTNILELPMLEKDNFSI